VTRRREAVNAQVGIPAFQAVRHPGAKMAVRRLTGLRYEKEYQALSDILLGYMIDETRKRCAFFLPIPGNDGDNDRTA
jgi:hypothetical protein